MAFAMISAFLEQLDRKGLVLTSLFSMLTINGWIWLGMRDMIHYAGLSGIINALLALLLYRLWPSVPSVHLVGVFTAMLFILSVAYTHRICKIS